MKSTLACILLFAVLLIAPAFGEKLKLVILHHRHGARNAFKTWGKSPVEYGQLTPIGLRQLYILGHELRKRYADDLNIQNYDVNLVYSRSTQFNRTLLSAQAFWSGFYPSGTGPSFKSDYPMERAVPPIGSDFNVKSLGLYALPRGIQPVPVHSSDPAKDWVLQAYDAAACPNVKKMLNNSMTAKLNKEMTETFMPTFKEVAEVMKLNGSNVFTISYMSSVADYLYSNYMSNYPTEISPTSDLWQKLFLAKNATILTYYYPTRADMNLFTTKLYEDMLARIDAIIAGKSLNRFIEFSSHDLTLNLILVSLNITSYECLYEKYKNNNFTYDPKCPYTTEVAANLIFELWENEENKTYSVKFLYNGLPYPINGKDSIPYDEFATILRNSMVPDFFDRCIGKDTVEESMPVWQIVIVAMQGVIIVVLAWLFVQKRMEVSKAMANKESLMNA